MESQPRRLPDWALVFSCVLPLLGFWLYGLFDLDEGFYGAVVRDMVRHHEWITPTLNGTPWFEKPILAYWLAVPSVLAFGDAVGPRLPSALCTLATVLVLFRFALARFGLAPARLTVLIYATNILVVGIGRMMMTDAPLVLCLTLAVTSLINWRFQTEADPRGWRTWPLLGLFVGLGVLAKGPVALILFGGLLIAATFTDARFRGVWRTAWPIGLLACGVVVATWYVPCYLANGNRFVQEFLIQQNFGRFAGGDKAHSVPIWTHPVYFPVVLAVAFVPWVFFSRGVWRTDADGKLLVVWFLVPFLFFTVSGTKLPHYILPAVAPLAVLLAQAVLKSKPSWPWEHLGLGWSAALLVLAQVAFMSDYGNRMADVRAAAVKANSLGLPVYLYKVGGSGDTSISTELRDTSHPSFYFYSKAPAAEADEAEDWMKMEKHCLVLTTRSVYESELERFPKLYRVLPDGSGRRLVLLDYLPLIP